MRFQVFFLFGASQAAQIRQIRSPKAEAHDYGKGRYFSDACLWCSANHNALGQLANQSRLGMSEGGACIKRSV